MYICSLLNKNITRDDIASGYITIVNLGIICVILTSFIRRTLTFYHGDDRLEGKEL